MSRVGFTHTDETKAKIRLALSGRVGANLGKKYGPASAIRKAKTSAALLGVKKSAEHAANIAKARTGVYWEVKGWLDPKSQMKIGLFRAQYPERSLVVATLPVIKQLEVF